MHYTELQQLPAKLEMNSSRINVFRFSLQSERSQQPTMRSVLCEAELARADRFLDPQVGFEFVKGRYILRRLLATALAVGPTKIEFCYGEHGKPGLASAMSSPVVFNLSHSNSMALLAISMTHQLGVDIEFVQERSEIDKIAKRFFSKAEVASYLAQPRAQQQEAFFRCWTRKEAYLKAVGAGLSFPLKKFCVTLGSDEQARLLRHDETPSEVDRWQVIDLFDGNLPQYQSALFTEQARPQISTYSLSF